MPHTQRHEFKQQRAPVGGLHRSNGAFANRPVNANASRLLQPFARSPDALIHSAIEHGEVDAGRQPVARRQIPVIFPVNRRSLGRLERAHLGFGDGAFAKSLQRAFRYAEIGRAAGIERMVAVAALKLEYVLERGGEIFFQTRLQ